MVNPNPNPSSEPPQVRGAASARDQQSPFDPAAVKRKRDSDHLSEDIPSMSEKGTTNCPRPIKKARTTVASAADPHDSEPSTGETPKRPRSSSTGAGGFSFRGASTSSTGAGAFSFKEASTFVPASAPYQWIDTLVLNPTLCPDHESNKNFRKFVYSIALTAAKERLNRIDTFGLPRPLMRLLGNAQNEKDDLIAQLEEMESQLEAMEAQHVADQAEIKCQADIIAGFEVFIKDLLSQKNSSLSQIREGGD